jgi:NitT/TauT family transport system substrate-binding protein
MVTFRKSTACLFIGCLLMLVACNSGTTTSSQPITTVRLQMDWVHEYSVASFYAAEKNGHFAANNITIEMHEGGFNKDGHIDPIEVLLSGNADFALTNDFNVIQARAAGKPIVAVASIVQRSPVAIISLTKSNIRRPQDLIGRTIAVAGGGSRLIYDAFLASQKLDPTQINTVERTTFGIDPLMNGEVDALVGWIINEAVLVREAGAEPNVILMSDYGVDSYNMTLFTTETIIKEKPELVQRFVGAVVQGIEDVVDNPEEAIKYTLAYGKDLKYDAQMRRLQAMLPLLIPFGSKPGSMSEQLWDASFNMVKATLPSETFDVKSVYTLAFIQKVNS